jgi:1,4-dihydroxy-2-naphthoate octaprenyltransferase
VVFGAAFLVGLNLIWYGGWWLLAVGAASIVFGYLYTAGPFALAYNGLGDVFVLVFFGLIAVGFTFFVQTGFFAWECWAAGAAIGALAVNILTVNNYRDRETDARSGKRTLAVRFGPRFALGEYVVMGIVAFAVPLIFFRQGYGWGILLPWVLIPVKGILFHRLRRAKGREANAILGRTAALLLGYGLLFSVALGIS